MPRIEDIEIRGTGSITGLKYQDLQLFKALSTKGIVFKNKGAKRHGEYHCNYWFWKAADLHLQ